jgi:beta-aspartyl-peptidase (threonine type)
MTDEEKQAHISGLDKALTTGYTMLGEGKDAISVVEAVIRILEDDSLFNAGRGAVLTTEGFASHDASIMSGKDLSAGAAGDVRRIKNPISLARMIMEKSSHVLLVGDGAEKFAAKQGAEFVPPEYFITDYQKATLQQRLEQMNKAGTVGCVVLDKNGNLAAGTSTGGMTAKLPGRLGDAPIIGAGTYANNKTCAVSATGWGEKFIKNAVAFRISALMEYKGYTLKQAVKEVLDKNLSPKDGGVIAVDQKGNFEMYYTTPSMYRGVMTSGGIKEIKIWE